MLIKRLLFGFFSLLCIVMLGLILVYFCNSIVTTLQHNTDKQIVLTREEALRFYNKLLIDNSDKDVVFSVSPGANEVGNNSQSTSDKQANVPNPLIYFIDDGDTLTSISARFGYSVDQIANYNQVRDVNLIYSNSVLRLPID